MSYIRKSFQERPSNNYLLQQDRSLSYTASYGHAGRAEYPRGRYSSNDKKYDYQNQINQSKQQQINTYANTNTRARTPSAGQFSKYNKYQNMLTSGDNELAAMSHNKIKRIAKNYAAGIGGANFSEYNNAKEAKDKSAYSVNKYMNIQQPNQPYHRQDRPEKKENSHPNISITTHVKTYENKPYDNKTYDNESHHKNRHRQNSVKQKSYNRRAEEDVVKDSFERVNEEKILQKITRINKLNSQINERLQRILAKVTND